MYLIRDKGNNQKAHIWNKYAEDTECFMWSTGGMNKNKGYSLHKTSRGKEICLMCKNNYRESNPNNMR